MTGTSMELDLDAFLDSQSTGDDNDNDDDVLLNSIPHRTVDEILNDSDTSYSSPSSPSSPSSLSNYHLRSRLSSDRSVSDAKPESFSKEDNRPRDDGALVYSPKTLLDSRVDETLIFSEQSKNSSISRIPSGEYSGDSFLLGRNALRSLPPLFGGVRSNVKPGAALAAAAAASRSIPTPHAAAIKSRRANSVTLAKVLETQELGSKPGDSEVVSDGGADFEGLGVTSDVTISVGSETRQSDGNLVEEDDKMGDFLAAAVELAAKVDVREELSGGVVSNDTKDKQDPSPLADDNNDVSVFIHSAESVEQGKAGRFLREMTLSSRSDVTDLIEGKNFQWESEKSRKRTGKKSRSSVKPLELAEELEKKHAFTGLHWEQGAAAQPMRLEGVRRGSTVLGYFEINANNTITRTISSQEFRRDHGSPQVVAVHLHFIAVGMSKGVVVLVPSKYSPHCADNMDAKMVMLGLQGDRSFAPVTSMCFNQQGDLLFAGYGDGHITVWDVQKGSTVKVITGLHVAPVVHMLYLGQDSQVNRQFSFKTACLLDGKTTGRVLCASPLLSDECCGGALMSLQGNTSVSNSGIGSMMGGVVGGDAGWKFFAEGSSLVEEGVVIFVTHQTALVARVTPDVQVYAQLPKPDGAREGSMPYTAWKCMAQSHGSSTENMPVEASEKVSLLAIAWDRKVQVAKLVKSELKFCGKWTLESAAIGVAWLDDQMLVVLTLNGQLCLSAKDGTMIHQTSFSVDGSGGDDLVVYHTHFANIFGNPEKAYHNCVAVRGASIYILGPMHLVVSRLLPWKERIQVLRKAGDWMGALNMAMSLYDGQAHGVIDLPRTLDAVQEAIMPYLVELLMSYVDEVFSYISVAFCNQIGKLEQLDESKSRSSSVHLDMKEQFTRVGGVAVEFSVHIKRTDILFDEIHSKFVAVQHRDTFLELLEPYILKDMLGSLPPEIMQALVEHYSMKGWLQRVEQCVLHMDISSLDFNQVVRLCQEHRLYGALIYLFNRGLDDFRTPLEELLVVLRNSQRETAAAIGYRMLVYLKYCFSGLAFPPGHGTLPPTRLPSLRIELVQFLLEDSNAPNSWVVTSLSSAGAYLNLFHLLELDIEATLDVLTCAFVEDEIPKSYYSLHDSANENMEAMKENDSMAESQNLLVQKTVNALVHILETVNSRTDRATNSDDCGIEEWPSKKDIGHIFEFIAFYVSCKRASVSIGILSQIFEYFTSEINLPPSVSRQNIETLKRREKQVLALLEVVPETEWDASYLLLLCEKAQFYQVCGLINAIRHQYLAALDSYMKDVDEPIHAFSFINDTLPRLNDTESNAFQSAVISRIPDLVNLSREGTFFLIIDHFSRESQHILSELRSHPKSLFLYLKTVVEVHLSGTLNFSCLRKDDIVEFPSGRRARDQSDRVEAYLERISDFPKLIRNNPVNVTDEMIELYLELLCQYERNSVLKFLETFESYRVEHCLRLCQEYGIIDAASFLLERVGDVGSALSLTLSGLNDKFVMLDTALGSEVSDAGMEHFSTIVKEEVNDIHGMLHACIGMCQRNTPRLDPEESESLWFRLLDS
ncbi:hypothetical protein F0562_009799 [Nyssa sinensis]|uniref:Vacuolar protein sorting-associated protein 8 central domain-containing protein n=1 Tax=Nyssa sinensis TaxID=561372 RepID=A0A5J4ZZY1_9ASTE|nr:hypothetical protein F0562_009799 [Nyssa sinensis]